MSNSDEMRYAVSANVYPGTFVTVRPCLEGDINGRSNFRIWEEQMLCLLDSQGMAGFVVDGELDPPIKEEWRRRDRLVKGWILGSIGKDALDAVWDQPTARSTWLELHRFFDTKDSAHEHEHENEHELENKNENEIEHEHENENENENESILGDFEHKHDNSNGALRFQSEHNDESEHDNDSSAAAAGDVDYIALYKELYRAAQTGDWDTAEKIFKNKPKLCTAKITLDSETALHVAVLSGSASIGFVRGLVKQMPEEELSIKDSSGNTALHNAAIVGNYRAAHALLKRNPNLLYVWSYGNNRLPVQEAAINCQKLTLQYLIRKHEKDKNRSFFEGRLGIQLLNEIIASQFVDFALDLVHRYPSLTLLTNEEDGTSALSSLIAATYTLFRRTERSLQRFVYHFIAPDLVYKYPKLTLLTNEEDGTSALSSLIAATYTLFRRTKSLLQRFVYHCIPVQRLQFEASPTTHATTHDIENLGCNCETVIDTCCAIYRVWKKLQFIIRNWNVVEFLVPRGLKELKQKKQTINKHCSWPNTCATK